MLCRKAVFTNNVNVRKYLDEIADEKVNKLVQRSPYKKLDIRSRPVNFKNSYKNLDVGSSSRSHETIRDLDFSSSTGSAAALDASDLPPFEKNFYKLHPDTEDFPDVSQTDM